mgnify:CR=1 FL=1
MLQCTSRCADPAGSAGKRSARPSAVRRLLAAGSVRQHARPRPDRRGFLLSIDSACASSAVRRGVERTPARRGALRGAVHLGHRRACGPRGGARRCRRCRRAHAVLHARPQAELVSARHRGCGAVHASTDGFLRLRVRGAAGESTRFRPAVLERVCVTPRRGHSRAGRLTDTPWEKAMWPVSDPEGTSTSSSGRSR